MLNVNVAMRVKHSVWIQWMRLLNVSVFLEKKNDFQEGRILFLHWSEHPLCFEILPEQQNLHKLLNIFFFFFFLGKYFIRKLKVSSLKIFRRILLSFNESSITSFNYFHLYNSIISIIWIILNNFLILSYKDKYELCIFIR